MDEADYAVRVTKSKSSVGTTFCHIMAVATLEA